MVATASRREVDLIMKALLAPWSRLAMNAELSDFRELAFQLAERLADESEEMKRVKQRLGSVRKWTRRPHVLPGEGCLENGRRSAEEAYAGGKAHCVELLPDLNRVIAGVEFREALLVDVRSAEIVKRRRGHADGATSVAVSQGGRWMVSGSWGRTMPR